MIPKPEVALQNPRGRMISIGLDVGGIGDAISLGPLIDFCGRGHPRSQKCLFIPPRHFWVFRNHKFIAKVADFKNRGGQPAVFYENEWVVKEEMAEFHAYGRVLSRARRMSAKAGNSLVVDHRPHRIPYQPVPELEGKIVCALQSTAASRSCVNPEKLLTALRTECGVDQVINLDECDSRGCYRYGQNDMVAAAATARIVVTVDTGILHIANAYDRRVVLMAGYTGVCGFSDYDSPKVLRVCGKCPQNKYPCFWEIACKRGTRGQRERQLVDCMDVPIDSVLGAIHQHTTSAKRVLVMMPIWNLLKLSRMAVESIKAFHNMDVLLVDNGSTDGSVEFFRQAGYEVVDLPGSSVPEAQNIGLQRAVEGEYDYIFFMNNDVVLPVRYIDKAVELMEGNKGIGLLTGTTKNENGPMWVNEVPTGNALRPMYDLVQGAYSATIFRVSAIKEVGLFDINFAPRYIFDNDYNLRMHLAGWPAYFTDMMVFYHDIGATVHKIIGDARNRDSGTWEVCLNYFKKKWGSHPHLRSQKEPVFTQPFNRDRQLAADYSIDTIHNAFRGAG